MSRIQKSKRPSDERIMEILTLIALGELEVEDAASALGITADELEAIVSKNPALADTADTRAREIQADPEHTLLTSQRGLAAIASTLAKRVQEQPNAMSVGEMVSAGSLLEKIAGVSEKRKLELKSKIDHGKSATAGTAYPIVIFDERPCPIDGKRRRLGIFMVAPSSPHWVDFSDPAFQQTNYCWLSHHAPLSPETGEVLKDQLDALIASVGVKYMDSQGRLHGAHL